MIVDIHFHLFKEYYQYRYPGLVKDIDKVVARLFGDGKLNQAWVLAFPGLKQEADTEDALAVARRYPGLFVPFGYLDLRGSPRVVDELRDKGCVGLKSIFPPWPYDDERLFPFYGRAEALKMPLLCHMGRCGIFPPYTIDDEFDLASQSSAYHHPKAVRAIAENFPGLRSIIGHSHGSTEVRSGSRETSGSGPLGLHLPSSMPEFSRIRRRVGHSCQLGAIARGPDGVREHPLLAERCYSLAPKALRRE